MSARILIITPALASANNGNWHTAARWSRHLRQAGYRVAIALQWTGQPADLMIALHARRSADSIAGFAEHGGRIALVLTGTDLYRDIDEDPSAIRSLHLADRLVLLQAEGIQALPEALRDHVSVIHQSAPALGPLAPRRRSFDLVMAGHARSEKDPMTALRALQRLDPSQAPRDRLRLRHIGGDREPALYAQMLAMASQDARIRLLGALPHAATRREIARAQALLLPSLMEGGANVLIEAVTSDVPVLASRISGSIGMLGVDYKGYFPVGDDASLAALLMRLQDDPDFARQLRQQGRRRAALFAPKREAAGVVRLVRMLLRRGRPAPPQTSRSHPATEL